jgi:hypothetical protein
MVQQEQVRDCWLLLRITIPQVSRVCMTDRKRPSPVSTIGRKHECCVACEHVNNLSHKPGVWLATTGMSD